MNKFFFAAVSAPLLLALGGSAASAEPGRRTRVESDTQLSIKYEDTKGKLLKELKVPVRAVYTEQSDEGRRRRLYSVFEDGSGVHDQPVEVLIGSDGAFEVTRGSAPAGLAAGLRIEGTAEDPVWKLLDGVPSRGGKSWDIPRPLVAELLAYAEADLASCEAVGRAEGDGDPRLAEHLVFDFSGRLAAGTSLGGPGFEFTEKNRFRMQLRFDRSASGLAITIRQTLNGRIVTNLPVNSVVTPVIPAELRFRYRLQKSQTFEVLAPEGEQASSAGQPWNRFLASFLPRRSPEPEAASGISQSLGQ